jgi:hypothetical protein
MSAPSDHEHEMLNETLTDDAIEAFFLGLPDPAWEHEASLVTLADDMAVAMNASAPVADQALLQLFWETPAAAETTRTAVVARNEPVAVIGDSRSVGWFRGRRRLFGVALGAALALSGVGVAGAAGVLPAPAQRVVAGVVEAVSPFELPHPDGRSREPSGGGAVTTGDRTGNQAPTAGQQPTVSTPGASSHHPQATPPASAPSSGPPAAPGSSGLDRARQTPAGDSMPPFVPGPGIPPNPFPGGSGTAPAPGLDTARQTPAASVPASVPGPPIPESASSRNR